MRCASNSRITHRAHTSCIFPAARSVRDGRRCRLARACLAGGAVVDGWRDLLSRPACRYNSGSLTTGAARSLFSPVSGASIWPSGSPAMCGSGRRTAHMRSGHATFVAVLASPTAAGQAGHPVRLVRRSQTLSMRCSPAFEVPRPVGIGVAAGIVQGSSRDDGRLARAAVMYRPSAVSENGTRAAQNGSYSPFLTHTLRWKCLPSRIARGEPKSVSAFSERNEIAFNAIFPICSDRRETGRVRCGGEQGLWEGRLEHVRRFWVRVIVNLLERHPQSALSAFAGSFVDGPAWRLRSVRIRIDGRDIPPRQPHSR